MSFATLLPPSIPLSVRAWLVQEVVFHAIGLLFEWSDRRQHLHYSKVRDVDRKSYSKMLPRVLLNQFFVLLPSMMLAEHLGLCFTGRSRLPTVRFIANLFAMAIGHDVVQYIFHRYFLHRPNVPLMRFLRHSVHHSTGATKAISACYMSVPDFFLEIVLPYLVPLTIVGGGGSDVFFHTLIAGSGAFGGLYEHSGYDFSVYFLPSDAVNEVRVKATKHDDDEFSPSSLLAKVVFPILAGFFDNRAHTEHHIRGNVSFSDGFGSPGICDSLFGTRWDLNPLKRQQVEREWQAQRKAAALH